MLKFGNTYLNFNGIYFDGSLAKPDPNPLNLPTNTIRVKFKSGYTPTQGNTQTLVDSTNNVWDIYKSSVYWDSLFNGCTDLLEVLGANTTNLNKSMNQIFRGCTALTSVALFDTSKVNSMNSMFNGCTSLTSVPLFDTSKVTNMNNMFDMGNVSSSLTSVPLFNTSSVTTMLGMFQHCHSLISVPTFDTSNVTNMSYMLNGCYSLTSVPLFDTSKVTNMNNMCYQCFEVQSGALSLYNQASSQTTVPSHDSTFRHCGMNTQTGSAELALIPSDWK